MLKLNHPPRESCNKINSVTQGHPTSAPLILEGYIRRAELARMLNVTERTVYRWELLRIGPPRVVVGALILYRLDSIQQWLKSREQQPLPITQRRGHTAKYQRQRQSHAKTA